MHLETEILSSNREGTARAAQILNAGGLVAFPTETVYGLGADCTNPSAIEKIYKTKGRPEHNPLIIHAYDVEEAGKFVQMDPKATKLADSFWPGPLTLVLEQKIPEDLKINKTSCIIGLIADPERLSDIRRNRVAIMKDQNLREYTDLNFIKKEVEDSKNLFKRNNWPIIDVTRKSVEETAASILKIIEIKKNK